VESTTSAWVLRLGDGARVKIQELAAAAGAQGRAVRVYAEARSCRGPVYGMSFDEPTPSDLRLEARGLTLVVDLESLPWVSGLRIDYQSTPAGGGFVFSRASDSPGGEPAACGCNG
jgi:iron-sulfur cluster assembly accessory protein